MKDKIIITNRNRDNSKVWFEREHDNVYSIHADKDYVLKYACENYEELPDDAMVWDAIFKNVHNKSQVKAHICSFDPAGGPYMEAGSILCDSNIRLKRIFTENDESRFELEEVK